jgi:catechol 2,3-dioxygenase-like lactoylglutathione lyase family enzyme
MITENRVAVAGLNHVTLAVSDVAQSFDFYVNLLGMTPRARWSRGAYLSSAGLWLCLSVDDVKPAADYTHIAFSVPAAEIPEWQLRFAEADVSLWKENTSEGESIYFLDPDGHQLELHAGDLQSRLDSIRLEPYEALQLFD